ncbi:hypothetical protein APHAL10511_004425 [Amanita phalloides]|nr:hypothetical protein APHAL10511_004425 [Amanita phalloides]
MVNFSFVVVTFLASTACGAPIKKRINQVIDQSMVQWQAACVAAGGSLGDVCNPQAIKSFDTLLANAGPCDQQNEADNMIDLAHKLNNNAQMIKFTQIYVQQPRNSPSSQSVPYCQDAPRNSELKGLFQCQFAGVDPNTFVGGIPVGSRGTIPFGQTSKVDPPGSCPAHPSGPIPNGTQLVDIVQSPGSPGSGSGSDSGSSGSDTSSNSGSDTSSNSGSDTSSNSGSDTSSKSGSDTSSNPGSDSGSPGTSGSGSTAGNFHLDNGQQAQKLNAGFAQLDENSSCTEGQNACVKSQFAQCVNGKFVGTSCSATLGCFALPLVNKPGTSVVCTTQSDAQARIAATGVQGGVTG